jgi:hypothetical protein
VQIAPIPLVISPNRQLYWAEPYTNAKQTGPCCQWLCGVQQGLGLLLLAHARNCAKDLDFRAIVM